MVVRIDVVRAISEAIDIVSKGKHDPMRAHERVRTFYNWENVTERTEKVYEAVMVSKQMDLGERIQRYRRLLVFSINKQLTC
jgi:phosphatidylinositol glycan class A protein